jgi:hypothetical protein
VILYDLANTENHPHYQALAISNGDRQYSFLQSVVTAACDTGQTFLSQAILKALNFHAIACLHTNAGEYRPCPVYVKHPDPEQNYTAPDHFRVAALMDNFINVVNRNWDQIDPAYLAAWVLWRLCAIHPFINGNGRTARAACYFVICVRSGGWLPGETILPTLLKAHELYVPALKLADANGGDVSMLAEVINDCMAQQMASAGIELAPEASDPAGEGGAGSGNDSVG